MKVASLGAPPPALSAPSAITTGKAGEAIAYTALAAQENLASGTTSAPATQAPAIQPASPPVQAPTASATTPTQVEPATTPKA
jgi:hypothetical protein